MTLVPEWYDEYMALAGGAVPIRDASGSLVVYDPTTEPGVNPVQDLYVANNFELPAPFLADVAALPATGNTTGLPSSPINAIAAEYSLVIPNDPIASVIGRVEEWAATIYGDTDLGVVRHSSGYLYADPTAGIRPGMIDLPRVVLPPHALVSQRR